MPENIQLRGSEQPDMCYTPSVIKEDWTLLAINASGEHGLSPVQLQKSLFLLGKQLAPVVEPFYCFSAYNYGPFSKEVYADAERMAERGFVAITKQPGSSYPTYTATAEGKRRAASLEQCAPVNATAYIHRVVDWASQLGFAELVRAIYAKYPEYRVNSVFEG